MIYLNYSRKEIVDRVDKIQHDLIREAMKIAGVEKGIEITTLADIPSEGTGLGSSSSITVALLQALFTYGRQSITANELSKLACDIEINRLNKPIGRQDQYIAAYGGMRYITFNKRIDVYDSGISPETKRRLQERLMLFWTGVTRKADPILAEQRQNIPDRIDTLCKLSELVKEGLKVLKANNVDEFGRMLDINWRLKKCLSSTISNGSIDSIYMQAKKAGALGGKITGAGGGGFLLLYCPLGKRDNVRQALSGLRELPFAFEEYGCRVIGDYR